MAPASGRASPARVAALTLLALLAFAANSLLARMALRDTGIDPAGFTIVRLVSGALLLVVLLRHRGGSLRGAGDWPSALALFAYAVLFSYAYVALSTGTGALLLFGAVQATMVLVGWRRGERLDRLQWSGFAVAVLGLLVLLLPGATAPEPLAALLMLGAGLAWGLYSAFGRGHADPMRVTAGNFVRTLPLCMALGVAALPWLGWDGRGVLLAVASGALTSALGYAVWYAALRHIDATRAATVQLSVPVIAALLGLVFLLEPIGLRWVVAALAVLGGIALVVARPPRRRPQP
ncbi:MAG: DMT family transporter [Lysobacteraceae bacterium]